MKPIIAIPATLALIVRAWKKKSLTPAGLVAATLTAIAHAYHPWNLPFVLLVVFFLAGTRVTHVKENVKASLTLHSKGSSGGEGPRTHVQVLANSLMGSVLAILHGYQLRQRAAAYADPNTPAPRGTMCFSWGGDVLVIGIMANYAAVAADTFSSELGILANSEPRLITSPTLRRVPRGTNGGVTAMGLAAGLLGSMVIVTAAMLFLPTCGPEWAPWTTEQRRALMGFLVVWGFLGSVVDSLLGGLFQRSVKDVRSGKIVEGEGGSRVLVSASGGVGGGSKRAEARASPGGDGRGRAGEAETGGNSRRDRASRVVESGWDLLDNNDVNFLMACAMSVGGMAVASWYWGVPMEAVLKP